MEQVTQIENEAARLTLPPWEQAQQNIVDQYNQRVQKAHDALEQQLSYDKLTAAGRRAHLARLQPGDRGRLRTGPGADAETDRADPRPARQPVGVAV